jgi:hypothetical protein
VPVISRPRTPFSLKVLIGNLSKKLKVIPAFHTVSVETEDVETFPLVEAYWPFSAFEQMLENELPPF